jgi:hypothetical protein
MVLREAALAGVRVELEAGEYAVTGPLVVAGSIALVGAGAAATVLRPADPQRGDLVKVQGAGATVVLRGLTLRAGRSMGGAALEATGDNHVALEDCIVEGCVAERMGGGGVSASDDVDLELLRCILRRCRAPRGGALFVGQQARARVDRCVFEGNEAEVGGAVCAAELARIEISSSTFVGNAARRGGGGAALVWMGARSAGPEVTVASSLFAAGQTLACDAVRAGTARVSHSVLVPGTLAGSAGRGTEDGGGNVEGEPSLVEIERGLWGLAPGSIGAGIADAAGIEPGARDLTGRLLVVGGRADPGALGRPGG